MCISYLGFVLLIWFPGALHGQSAPQSCSAPTLDGGFFAPKQETYPHGAQLAYTCGTGRKATVKGWWATSTCQNGKWSHELQCIDEKACIPPTIPNAKYTENSNGWYEEGHIIRITCDKGYQDKNQDATAECINGTWSSVPVCEKSIQACGAPPKIPHAVIINQEYQDVFAADSEVKYECEDGFTVEGADTKKTIICIAGSWTTGPPCRSSTTSDRDSRPLFTTIDNCGDHPNVPHGDVVVKEQMYLKYQCQNDYKYEGPETVVCHNDGTWSKLPVCKDITHPVSLARHNSTPPRMPKMSDWTVVRLQRAVHYSTSTQNREELLQTSSAFTRIFSLCV
ncbi:complement factor H-related protein 1-like [Thunnus maccoyii]|uniref:complement factor H-related protein 1-like n=1 Tax=Thunnus maccoyii TaxID=8240 RepID=UPI001C4CD774|nr:complement factor H-related protein 1-like [Thunnus maccoyii]